MVVQKGSHVDMGDFNDDLQRYEMDDGMLDSVLIQKHVQIENFSRNIKIVSTKDHCLYNLRMSKLVRVVSHIFP